MKALIYTLLVPFLLLACNKKPEAPPKAVEAPPKAVELCQGSIEYVVNNCPEAKNITLFWLQQFAQTKDAVIRIKDGKVHWVSGEWISGDFYGDVWESGTWTNGKWYGKEWKTGIVNGQQQNTPPTNN